MPLNKFLPLHSRENLPAASEVPRYEGRTRREGRKDPALERRTAVGAPSLRQTVSQGSDPSPTPLRPPSPLESQTVAPSPRWGEGEGRIFLSRPDDAENIESNTRVEISHIGDI